MSLARPPKPSSSRSLADSSEPRGVIALPMELKRPNGPPMRDLSSSSVASRESLRHDVQRRRNSLTAGERVFLERLCLEGDEVEVQAAHDTLMDTELFFERKDNHDNSSQPRDSFLLQEESERGWTDEVGIRVGKELESSANSGSRRSLNGDGERLTTVSNPITSSGGRPLAAVTSSSDPGLAGLAAGQRPAAVNLSNRNASDALGSDKRRQHLANRRNSIMFGRVWKSHANGLAVSDKQARRSLVARRNSLSSSLTSSINSSGRMELYMRPETQSIFRGDSKAAAAAAAATAAGMLMDDNRTDNNRNSSRSSSRRHSFTGRSSWNTSSAGGKSSTSSGRRSSPRSSFRVAPKPTFRRMMSEGSRKSVTFKDIPDRTASRPERIMSDGCAPPPHPPAPPSTTTDASSPPAVVPPIPPRRQQVFPRRGSASSIHSIPSLHQAHPIRSPSATSFASLHLAHHVHSSDARSSVTSWTPSMEDDDDDDDDDGLLPVGDASSREEKKTDNDALAPPTSTVELVSPVPAWSAPVPTNVELINKPEVIAPAGDGSRTGSSTAAEPDTDDDELNDDQRIRAATKLLSHDQELPTRPVIMRRASKNSYNGEGIEVADYDAAVAHPSFTKETIVASRQLESLASFGADGEGSSWAPSLKTPFSFDETMSFDRLTSIFRRKIERSLSSSDENMNGIFLGGSRLLLRETSSLRDVHPGPESDDDSWGLDDEPSLNYYDAWKVIEDEYVNGYGGGNSLGFLILGTSAHDEDCHPHVCSPPLLDSLLSFMPSSVSCNNYWLKYSAIRDGFSLYTLLMHARGAKYSVLAIETVDGEVFGCFTTEPWRKNWNWFGSSSGESFLWRMRGSRQEMHHSIIDQAKMESELDIYPYTGENQCIQLCTNSRIAVGGGMGDFGPATPVTRNNVHGSSSNDNNNNKNTESASSAAPPPPPPPMVKDHEWGFGLALESDLLYGTSSPSATFASPSLSRVHADGTTFEITNIELWTLTPCSRLEEAEKLELGLLFLKGGAGPMGMSMSTSGVGGGSGSLGIMPH